jgi:hypothetical protein
VVDYIDKYAEMKGIKIDWEWLWKKKNILQSQFQKEQLLF